MTTSTETRLDSYAALNDSLQGRNLASRKLGNNTYALRLDTTRKCLRRYLRKHLYLGATQVR